MKMKGRKIAARCPKCGETDFFVCEGETHICSTCGAYNKIGTCTRRVYVNCECGCRTKILTNKRSKLFDAICWGCGAPMTVEWNPKKHVYQTVKE